MTALKLKMKLVFAGALIVALAVQNVAPEETEPETEKSIHQYQKTEGQCCMANPPTRNGSMGIGKVEEFAGLNTYFSGPADSKIAVLLLPDIYGVDLPHAREITDKIGAAGYYAVAPDLFRGNPYIDEHYQEWMADHPPEKGFQDVKPVVEALKSKGMTKIGAVGFCWGAKVVVLLSQAPDIQVGVLIHPSLTDPKDIQGVKVPLEILAGELDQYTHLDQIKELEAALKAKPDIESMVKIFPGVDHGWSLRYNETNQKSAEESHQDMLNWLNNHLK